jgi:hypothetical protein
MDVRASDAERDACVEQLRTAAAEGRLTFEELADRIDAASTAVMRSDLARLVSDLPTGVALAPPATAPSLRAMGDIVRSGAWAVPAESHFRTWMGNVKLDLRQATITAHEVHIHARTIMGNVDVLVPEGVEVDVRANPTIGKLKHETGQAVVPGAPRIVITGGTLFGDIKVRHRRLWEKLTRRLSS